MTTQPSSPRTPEKVDPAANAAPRDTSEPKERLKGAGNGEIEADVQALLSEMQSSFKNFSETVFSKSAIRAAKPVLQILSCCFTFAA
jgi:hypothetical protein